MADICTLALLALVYAAGLLLFWYGARLWYRPADVVDGGEGKVSSRSDGKQSLGKAPADSSEWQTHEWWAHWPDISYVSEKRTNR